MNRSDFFVSMVNVCLIYLFGSSCWLEGKAKTPAESEAWHGNQQRCQKWFIRAYWSHCSLL